MRRTWRDWFGQAAWSLRRTERQKIESQEHVLNVGESTFTNTAITWDYNADGHLTDEYYNDGVTADSYHDHYDYDLAGNRTEEDIDEGDTGSVTKRNYYTYDDDGQLVTETDGTTTSINYNYDANGSLTETDSTNESTDVTVTTSYGYDARNRLASMTNSSGTITYSYNDGGDRIGQTSGSSTTSYLVDDNNPTGYSQVLETWTGGPTPAITYEIGAAIISQTVSGTGAGSGTQYIMVDGSGSTRQLTAYASGSGSNGTVIAREDYDAFGCSIIVAAAPANIASTVILYTGQMWDAGLGEYDLRLRYYDPGVGRFSSYDPTDFMASQIDDLNRYLYSNADPIDNCDPTGSFSQQFGYLAEVAIQAIYARDHWSQFGAIRYGGWTRLGIPGGPAFRLKPDIFNYASKRWAEIKPLSPAGIVSAGVQWATYTAVFAPFGYFADGGWTPSTHTTVVGTVPILFFNAGGIIFYTDNLSLTVNTILTLTTYAAVKTFAKTPAGQEIISKGLSAVGDGIADLIRIGPAGSRLELATDFETAVITD